MRHRSVLGITSSILATALLGACGDGDGDDHDHDAAAADAAAVADAAPADDASPQTVSVVFAARINGEPFACGQTYQGVGTPAAAYTANDFRFFIHDLRLVTDAGDEVAVSLDQDGTFQREGLALLDFEDGAAGCDMGTAATHTAVTGTVPPGAYAGVRFKLGVPDTMNHIDQATAPAPLNDSTMWWVWRAGYKYLKADGTGGAAANPFFVHLGATGCPGDSPTAPPSGACAAPNLVEISLVSFDVEAHTVVADLGAILAGADVTSNTATTAPGCMSAPNDPECATVFEKLGLPFGQTPAGPQSLFGVE